MKITQEQISKMDAGSEMDTLVAEILGYDVLGTTLCLPNPEYLGYFLSYGKLEDWKIPGTESRSVYLDKCICEFTKPNDYKYFGHNAGCLEVVPEYSKDICQALKLLEKYPWWKTETDLSKDSSICWHLRLGAPPEHKWFSGTGETIALAICRAILSIET